MNLMVAILEVDQKGLRKKTIANWWQIEGKIECTGAVLLFLLLIVFWDHLLVQACGGFFVSLWCLGKIYFRRNKWLPLLLTAILTYLQGVNLLFEYIRS